MIESVATVVAVGETWVQVECRRKSACGHCHQQASCGVGSLAKSMPGRPQLLELARVGEVSVGQQVRIGIPEKSLLKSALLVYMLPLFCLLVGALVGKWVSGVWQIAEELPEILGAMLGEGWASCWPSWVPVSLARGSIGPSCWELTFPHSRLTKP